MKDNYFYHEEEFHARDRKQYRKERRRAQQTDRSKFKKSDLCRTEKEEDIPNDDPRLCTGRVTAITGDGVWVKTDLARMLCSIKGLMKKETMLSKNILAVGDRVRILPNGPTEGSIIFIEERHSFLSRQDISGKKEQLIAVNIDQAIIVSSIASPPLKPALIDRYLIAAERGNIHPIIVINKIDQLDEALPEEKDFFQNFLAAYERLGYPILSISTITGIGLEGLRAILKNKTSVFAGQSGVGKSSLLNAAFGLNLKTGILTQKTMKGSHTTTGAELLTLPDGGFCIDTPGIRSFSIWNLQRAEILAHFHEFLPLAKDCRYPDCLHLNEPFCAVKQALEEEQISSLRYDSYKSLMDENIAGLDNRTKRKLDL